MKHKLPSTKISEYNLVLNDFSGGSNTVISEARLGKKKSNNKYAIGALNLQQAQDGIWETRPGVRLFGTQSFTDLKGGSEYVATDGTRHLVVIDGTTGYRSDDDGATWDALSGATFSSDNQIAFLQIKGQLWISNGSDPLCYYDGTTTLQTFSAITDPASAPTLTRGAGLSTGSFTYYVRYTANNAVGSTNPSPALTVTADYPREQWSTLTDGYIDYTLPSVSGALSYDVWLGDISGEEYFLGSTSTTVFRDDGRSVNIYAQPPDDNTTSAPKIGAMEFSGNRLWGTKNPDNPYILYGTGTGTSLGYFSQFYGGFDITIERGGRFKPVAVVHYRTGKGDPVVTVLCSSPDGMGTIFQVELQSLTIGDVTFTVPVPYKLVGSVGADATLSVTKFADNVGFINKKGVYFLRNKEQMFNVLATDDMTAPIRNVFQSLNESKIHLACGYWSPPRLYFSAAEGETNDVTFIFDMERRNWSWKWNIGFSQFFEFTSSDSRTHLLGISDGQLVEIVSSTTSDLGQAYRASYTSPLIPVNADDHTERAKIKEVIFELGEVLGEVTVEVLGKDKNGDVPVVAFDVVNSTTNSTGWGDNEFSSMQFSDTLYAPETYASSSRKIPVRVNKKVYATQYKVSSNSSDSYWQLLSIQVDGFRLSGRSPSTWR